MKKPIAVMLLMSMLILSLLTSCANDKPQENGGGAVSTGNGVSATETSPTEQPPKVEQQNFEGAEFCIAAYDAETYFWHAASYCEVFAESENGDPINDALYQRNRAVEERLNIKLTHYGIEANNRSIADRLKTLILAGEDLFDAATVIGIGIPTMIASGDMVLDLNTVEGFDLTAPWWDVTSLSDLGILNKNYIVTGDLNLYTQFAPMVFFVNKKLIENNKLDNPYDLVRQGKWTIDNSMEMMIAASHDLDGDGKHTADDSWGLCTESGALAAFMTGSGVRISTPDGVGGHDLTINTTKTVEIVEKLVPFMTGTDYVTLATYHSGYSNVFFELFIPMFMDDRALFFANQLLITMNLRDMDADFGILPYPKYNENQDNYLTTISPAWASYLLVPTTNSKPEITGSVLNAMGYYSSEFVTPAYIETTVLDKTLRDDDSAEMLEIILANRVYDLANFYSWGGISNLFSGLITKKSINFSSEYAAIEPNVISAMEKTFTDIQG